MKKNNTNFNEILTTKAYNHIGNEQLESILLEGNKLLEIKDIAKLITDNLDDYLTADEQKQLIINSVGRDDIEELNSGTIYFAILSAAINIHAALKKALENKDFVGDNPFSIIKNPKAFMICKYLGEKHGVKFNMIESKLDI